MAKQRLALDAPPANMNRDSAMAAQKHVDLLVVLHSHPGQEQELNQVLENLRDASVAEPGCIHYRLGQSCSNPTVIFIQERWVDATALRDHETTEHFLSGVAKIQPLCSVVQIHNVDWK